MGIKYSNEAQIQVKKAKVHSERDVEPYSPPSLRVSEIHGFREVFGPQRLLSPPL